MSDVLAFLSLFWQKIRRGFVFDRVEIFFLSADRFLRWRIIFAVGILVLLSFYVKKQCFFVLDRLIACNIGCKFCLYRLECLYDGFLSLTLFAFFYPWRFFYAKS